VGSVSLILAQWGYALLKNTEERKVKYLWLLIILFFVAAYHTCSDRTISRPAGVLIAEEPQQGAITDLPEIQKKDISLKLLASFDIKARVILAERYYFGRAADLAPVDLALGWGPMSDQKNLEYFKFSQSDRFYFWSAKSFPVPREVVESHTANMHMIPGNAQIEKLLKGLRPGHVIHLRGYLVEARTPDGWRWRSSLSRTDTGRGACELVLVESLEAY
jgi:hypothetical protein